MNIKARILFTKRRKELRKSSTKAESIIWIYLRRFRSINCIFRRQHSIDWYITDFYCPELKLAIELDGPIHDQVEQQEYDEIRNQLIKSHGIHIMRFKNQEIEQEAEMVMLQIRDKINELLNLRN